MNLGNNTTCVGYLQETSKEQWYSQVKNLTNEYKPRLQLCIILVTEKCVKIASLLDSSIEAYRPFTF